MPIPTDSFSSKSGPDPRKFDVLVARREQLQASGETAAPASPSRGPSMRGGLIAAAVHCFLGREAEAER